MHWISVEDRLPKDRQAVLVRRNRDNWLENHTLSDGKTRDIWRWQACLFKKGRTAEEMEADLKGDDETKRVIHIGDEHGNNCRPYAWDEFGPGRLFGQDVSHWAAIDPEDALSNEVATGLDVHIILYAKNNYGKSVSVIEDIKAIMAEYSATPIHFIEDYDAWECLASCAGWGLQYGGAYNTRDTLLDLVGKHHLRDLRTISPEHCLLGALRYLNADQFHYEDKWEDWKVPNDVAE